MQGNHSIAVWLRVSTAALFLCLALGIGGCKKQQPEPGKAKRAQQEQAVEKGEDKAKTPATQESGLPPGTAGTADTSPQQDSGQPEPAEGATSGKEGAEQPEEAKTPHDGPKTPSANTVAAPATDLEQLKEVFLAMWCAEQKGATPEELLTIYHKYDYPPLENWYDIWNNAVVDTRWARKVMAEARSTCPPEKEAADGKQPDKAEDPMPIPTPPVEEKAPPVEENAE